MDLRIAITGSFGNMDIGDEAMLTEDLAYIRQTLEIPDNNILLIGHRPDYMSHFHEHPHANCLSCSSLEANWLGVRTPKGWRYQLRRLIRPLLGRSPLPKVDYSLEERIAACDLALVTGGGTINTRDHAGVSLRRMHAMISYFRHLGLPIFMSGQTIGPLGVDEEHDRLAREIVDSVDVLTVRDNEYSRRYLNLIGSEPKRFLETFDDAFTLPYEDAELPGEVMDWFAQGGSVVAVNVTEYTSDESWKRVFVARLAERLLEEHAARLVFVSHHARDLIRLHSIRDMMINSVKGRVLIPDTRDWKDRALKKMISQCDLAIGGRYHFIVFAATTNTPFVGMCGNHYSYIKQDGFARALALEEFVLTENETWNMDVLFDRIGRATRLNLEVGQRCGRPTPSMALFGEWVSSWH
ncbi:MAG: polysaccharide pyruvyl transferase family protein [Gammaproteobacteria bacterium]|nr:polysaccharide pyruvyl transferase family protein [Gammaproteobacteria bacterium]